MSWELVLRRDLSFGKLRAERNFGTNQYEAELKFIKTIKVCRERINQMCMCVGSYATTVPLLEETG